jgi:hypothetical protein
MEYVNLGRAGVKVSRLCLGCMTYGSKKWREWVLEEEESLPFLQRALEAGINFFDTADMYSLGVSEEILGRALKRFGVPRDRVVIATKVFNAMGDDPNLQGLSRKHILHSIDDSLRRLGTDYVDLYQIHRFDYRTPIEETLRALDDIVRAGKALYLGASSMYAWQFAKMLYTADQLGLRRFVSMQGHYKPGLPRGRAGNDAAVPRGGHRPHSLEPAGARLLGRKPAARGSGRHLARQDRRVRPQTLLPGLGLRRGRPAQRSRAAAGSQECPDRPGVGPGATGITSPIIARASRATWKMRWPPCRCGWMSPN